MTCCLAHARPRTTKPRCAPTVVASRAGFATVVKGINQASPGKMPSPHKRVAARTARLVSCRCRHSPSESTGGHPGCAIYRGGYRRRGRKVVALSWKPMKSHTHGGCRGRHPAAAPANLPSSRSVFRRRQHAQLLVQDLAALVILADSLFFFPGQRQQSHETSMGARATARVPTGDWHKQ